MSKTPSYQRKMFETGAMPTPGKRNFVIKKKKKKIGGPQDEKSLTEQMKGLSKSTKNRKQAKRMGRNKEAIETLLGSLNRNPKFTKMVEYRYVGFFYFYF